MSDKKTYKASVKTRIYRWFIDLDQKIEKWVQFLIQQL